MDYWSPLALLDSVIRYIGIQIQIQIPDLSRVGDDGQYGQASMPTHSYARPPAGQPACQGSSFGRFWKWNGLPYLSLRDSVGIALPDF